MRHLLLLATETARRHSLLAALALSGASSAIAAPQFLYGWGDRSSGQFGDGWSSVRDEPVAIHADVSSVWAGDGQTLFIDEGGTLWAAGRLRWLENGAATGQLTYAPIEIATNVERVKSSLDATFFLTQDGRLWGYGIGLPMLGLSALNAANAPLLVTEDVADMAVGGASALYVTTSGELFALGSHQYQGSGGSDEPFEIASAVASVAAGIEHWLFLKTDGTLWGWGFNGSGALGIEDISTTVAKQIASNVVAADAAGHTTIYLKSDGSLWGLGANASRQLSAEPVNQHDAPVLIAEDVSRAALGDAHTAYVTDDGSLWYRGSRYVDYLGNPPAIRSAPLLLASGVVAVSASFQTAYITSDGNLWTFGERSSGTLGDGEPPYLGEPTYLSNDYMAVFSDYSHSLLLDPDGGLWATGANKSGQLGTGTTRAIGAPAKIADDVVHAATGAEHSLFVDAQGRLWAMGSNENGQLGVGTFANSNSPIQVASDVDFAVAGGYFSLFIKSDGGLWVMGSGMGADITDQTQPRQVAQSVARAAAGHSHVLFQKTDGTLWGFGIDPSGSLGSEFRPPENPTLLAEGARTFAAGAARSAYVTPQGELWAIGLYSFLHPAQDENGIAVPHLVDTDVDAVELGSGHLLYRKSDGSLWSTVDLGAEEAFAYDEPRLVARGVSTLSFGDGYAMFISRFAPDEDGDDDGVPALVDPNDDNPYNPYIDANGDFVPDNYDEAYSPIDYSPRIVDIAADAWGEQISITAVPGFDYNFEFSTDLVSWERLAEQDIPAVRVESPMKEYPILMPLREGFFRLRATLW